MEMDNELKEILNPNTTVLLIWDVQKRLVANIFNAESFLDKTKKVISSAKENDVQVIFSKITPLSGKFESPVRKYFFSKMKSYGAQAPNGLDLEIEPTGEDIVIPKNTASMFVGTNFELLLRNAGITTIILTGIATEFGVESTARDAYNRGFFPVIITDAVSSSDQEAHNRSLENIKKMSILLSTDELISAWK
jgi:nicotinamidase-related amidase